ncbi:MAG: hypothetical protein ACRDJ0_05350 [Actinomycetota bacterium]
MIAARRNSAVLPAIGFALIPVMFVASLFFYLEDGIFATALVTGWLAVLGGTGALVAARKRENPEGWLMLGSALLVSLFLFADAYASESVRSAEAFPLEGFSAWLTLWVAVPGFGLLLYLILLFPTGRLVSPGWKLVGWLAALGLAAQSLALAVRPGPIDSVRTLDNPAGVEAAEGLAGGPVIFAAIFAAELGAIVSMIVRWRRAGNAERQQIRWFVLAVLIFVAAFIGAQVLFAVAGNPEGSAADLVGFLAIMLGLTFIPIAMGIGMVRHGLYDIDRLINRTLVYGVVTAVLATGYLGIVLALQSLLPVADDSPVTVAASTLAVVALFRPVRGRVQSLVDRRFNRSRYDAARTIESFGARLRRETDLETLTQELLAVTKETMQPAHASLWLNGGSTGR